MVSRYLRDDMSGFLGGHDLEIDDIGVWVSHPGGPKVIEAISESLALPTDALELTWRSLAEIGNISSSSVLHILRDTMDKRPADGSPAGDDGNGSRILLGTRAHEVAVSTAP